MAESAAADGEHRGVAAVKTWATFVEAAQHCGPGEVVLTGIVNKAGDGRPHCVVSIDATPDECRAAVYEMHHGTPMPGFERFSWNEAERLKERGRVDA